LPLPALSVLASAAQNPNRRLAVFHILETTLINWQRQIKSALKKQPEITNKTSNVFTKNEIQLWTSYINKLNNLIVQLDAPHVTDILMNLENNNSIYMESFKTIKNDIRGVMDSAAINLRFISTLTPWLNRMKCNNLVEDAQYIFTGLFHTLLLIWKHSTYYHNKDKFSSMLLFLSNEIVSISKSLVGNDILNDPYKSYNKLKESLRICAMFRGTYLDFKEKADSLNSNYHKLEKKIDFNEKLIWWVQLYQDEEKRINENDEYEVLRVDSPWPKKNHKCFYHLNVFMERCNDVLELVQTMRHFQILSKTVSIGGADSLSMDLLVKEIHVKYVKALDEFHNEVFDVMELKNQVQNFDEAFFHFRTTIKDLERTLSQILNTSIKNCTTIASKLRLLQVFEGIHEREVIQMHLDPEHKWLINEMLKDFENVKQLANNIKSPDILPSVVTKLIWLHGLEQRIKVPMEKFSYLYPNLLQGDLGYQLRDSYRQGIEFINKKRTETLQKWTQSIPSNLAKKLQQTIFKNISVEDLLSSRPNAIEVNLDADLEKLLKEIHHLKMPPLNIDLIEILKNKFVDLKDENLLRLHVTRARLIADKYNLILKNIEPEEVLLFESKLEKIDEIIDQGLNEYTWNSVEIPDYIERAHSTICMNVYQNLEITQGCAKEIYEIVSDWCRCEADVFQGRDNQMVSFKAHVLEEKQAKYHNSMKTTIVRGGKRIHTLFSKIFDTVGISEASPGWQQYIDFTNNIIFNGFKISSLNSLRNMYNSLTNVDETKTPIFTISLEIIDAKLQFNPPLDENNHLKNLQEILFDFINSFIARGSFMKIIGKNRIPYDQMVARDDEIFDTVSNINASIEDTCNEGRKISHFFNSFSFLWTVDIHERFEEFLKGDSSVFNANQPRPPSKNFMSERLPTAKSIISLGSLTPEKITDIERKFLSPYYHSSITPNKTNNNNNNNTNEVNSKLTPLLQDFDNEISVYVKTQEKIKAFQNHHDIDWLRVDLQPTIDVLITLTNKFIWKFSIFLSNQIKLTLNELDTFLKNMEPDIENINGEERDTVTFMKIMRMFNEVSSKQQEMEIKFELIRKTLLLLKKYHRYDASELESEFNKTPVRWATLKSKVNLAKQRLGPTIHEESRVIIEDLKTFDRVLLRLNDSIMSSFVFDRECESSRAFNLLDDFNRQLKNLQQESDDLKQLQDLLEMNIVDFKQLTRSKITLNNLHKTWSLIKEIRNKHTIWKETRWQKVKTKEAYNDIDKQMIKINQLPPEAQQWDVLTGIKIEINNIKYCLPVLDEIANPAMRTRHWKQIVRISNSNNIIDNEALKTLTFGQLLELNLQVHIDEVKSIIQKAVRDLSIEQTIKTYEEVWLSKIFKLKKHEILNSEVKRAQRDEDEKSNGSKIPNSQLNTTKSMKRLSIGSLPLSLNGIEPIQDNDPVYLFEDSEKLFNELQHHQRVLEELLKNQAAGSFYDDIIKWQTTLQMIEAVLKEWDSVQTKWIRLEPIFCSNEVSTVLPQDAVIFYKADKDFRLLMKATEKNHNILKCCQRKNIINLLKHLNNGLNNCYDSLLHELTKRRSRCPRLNLISDIDLVEVICCGMNLERLSISINKVFNQIESLRFTDQNGDIKIIGFFGINKEFVPFRNEILMNNVDCIEDLLNLIEKSIIESLKYLLSLALKGSVPSFKTIEDVMIQRDDNYENEPNVMVSSKHSFGSNSKQKNNLKQDGVKSLPKIDEYDERSSNINNSNKRTSFIYSWIFQHTIQIVELSMRINFTKKIEECLEGSNFDELNKLDTKFNNLIQFYIKKLNNFQATSASTAKESSYSRSGIVINAQQRFKITLVIKLLVYYRSLVQDLLELKTDAKSSEWLSTVRYYLKDEDVIIKTRDSSVVYGFEYNTLTNLDDSLHLYRLANFQSLVANLISVVESEKTSILLHGNNIRLFVNSLRKILGYETHYFMCSKETSLDSIQNVCKAMVLSGYWIIFMNIESLSSRSMSVLSNILTQVNDGKENIIINNESYPFYNNNNNNKSDGNQNNRSFCFFGTISPKVNTTNPQIDSLKVTKIDNYLNLISKDLLDKFFIIQTVEYDVKTIIESNLIANGFTNAQLLSEQMNQLTFLYDKMIKVEQINYGDCVSSFLDPSLINVHIQQSSFLLHSTIFETNDGNDDDDDEAESRLKAEQTYLAICFCKFFYSRVDSSSLDILFNFTQTIWPHFKLPLSLKFQMPENLKLLNLPLYIEKETEIQIEDKSFINDINDAVSIAITELKLTPSIAFEAKVSNFIDHLNNHRNLLLIGESGCGKSSLIKTALYGLRQLSYRIDIQHCHINAYTNSQLFGDQSNFSDGIISNTIKNFANDSHYNILHLIGEEDAGSSSELFTFYEALFSDESFFFNHNNYKKKYSRPLKIIWESDNISKLSPAVISGSNIVYLDFSLVLWQHLIEVAFEPFIKNNRNEIFLKLKTQFIKLLETIKKEFDSNQFDYINIVPVTFESKVRLSLSILKNLMKINDRWSDEDIIPISEYCIVSGMSAAMCERSRELFNYWIISKLKSYPKEDEGKTYEYYYDIDAHKFNLFSDNIPTLMSAVHQGIPLNAFVQTSSTMFINSMLDIMINIDESFLICGETGCGKTSLILDKLKTSCSGDLTDVFYITINCNKLTTSNTIQNRINSHVSWQYGYSYVPKGDKRMFCFIDDIHQSNISETSNRQSALEFLRQHMDTKRYYDFNAKKWQTVKDITYCCTLNNKQYMPSHSKSNKILKNFHVIAQHFPSDAEVNVIYTKLLYRHLVGDVENDLGNSKNNMIQTRLKNVKFILNNIVQSSIELNNKMRSIYLEKSDRLHYVFTLRVLTSLFRHMCTSLTPDSSKERMLSLWHHECDWIYGHRMIDFIDFERYELAYKTVIKKNFNNQNELAILNRSTIFSNLYQTESGLIISGTQKITNSKTSSSSSNNNSNNSSKSLNVSTDGYSQVMDLSVLRNLIQEAINEYNKEHQRIMFPLYDSTIFLITRLCHTAQLVAGHFCILADGGITPFIMQIIASLMQFSLVQFSTSQFIAGKEQFFQQMKHKLLSSYYKAGIKGEKVILCLTEEEMSHREFLSVVTEFLISEEITHLYSIEEETTILNAIRTQVIQAGLVYTKEIAWEMFIKNIRENTRTVIILNENAQNFQKLALTYPSLFNNIELILVQHWSMKELIKNSQYHFVDIEWLDESTKENVGHLLAAMHTSIRRYADSTSSSHLNNSLFAKFVEKFKEFLINKYKEIETSHKLVCRSLEYIQKQNSTAKKLVVQLQQETMVMEERIKSTNSMLQQIGQDMTMTEQQIKVHNLQTRKTVKLKRILPEHQLAHERNLFKSVAILATTRKLIQNINMDSLQELRVIQKPTIKMEDTLAAVIIILKNPNVDLTWQKGAKRQMANLDRFIEELQTFDEQEITTSTVKIIEDLLKKIETTTTQDNGDSDQHSDEGTAHIDALNTLQQWIKNVVHYNKIMLNYVKPLYRKVEEIEDEVKEAELKLASLNRKSEALNARLKDLADNFEEATVDKKEQEEKVSKMKQQLKTASELNVILSREFERNMQIYNSVQERILSLPGACALAAGFLTYLGPFKFSFRRSMLTIHWMKCLNERGLPLLLDSISLINGRTIKWRMDNLEDLMKYSSEVSLPGDDWRVKFASEEIENEPFIMSGDSIDNKADKIEEETEETNGNDGDDDNESKPNPNESKNVNKSDAKDPRTDEDIDQSTLIKSETTTTTKKQQQPKENDENNNGVDDDDGDDLKVESQLLTGSRLWDTEGNETENTNYSQFITALIQYILGENKYMEWRSGDTTTLELENGTIMEMSQKHPPLIFDPFTNGTNWILTKITEMMVDLERRNSQDLAVIEKSFQSGNQILYTNCNGIIDSTLLPLVFYKNTMTINKDDDSKLLFFTNRKLFCNDKFQSYFEASTPLNVFSPKALVITTPISYEPSIENLVDQFQMNLFSYIFPEEYELRNLLMSRIRECNDKLEEIDSLIKKKWTINSNNTPNSNDSSNTNSKTNSSTTIKLNQDTNGDEQQEDYDILMTNLAFQRKYKIGEILEYCQEHLSVISNQMKIIRPLAVRAALLMTLALKMKHISDNYVFSIYLMEYIFVNISKSAKSIITEVHLKSQINISSSENDTTDNNGSGESTENPVKNIENELPTIPQTEDVIANKLNTYTNESIAELIDILTNSYLNIILMSLLPEHRLYLLTLVCFYIKLQERSEFSEMELEFLMLGKLNSNMMVTLADFGFGDKKKPPKWIPTDNFNDLMAMSLLQGDLDHFVVAFLTREKDWHHWYDDPLKIPMPSIEMEDENTGKKETVELNEFKKLMLLKVLRPDVYTIFLDEYVNKELHIRTEEPKWRFIFQNQIFKSVVINMGSKSNISNTSSMSRIHKNLFQIAKSNDIKIASLNCNYISLTELRLIVKEVTEGFVLMKNVHLASKDILDFIKALCDKINGNLNL
jgi:hypothetical protein